MTDQSENTDGGSRAGVALLPDDPGARLQYELSTQTSEAELVASLLDSMRHATTSIRGQEVPDHRVRLQAAMAILAYRHGRPIERQEIRTQAVPPDDVMDRLAKSTEGRRALGEYLRRVEDRARAVEVSQNNG